jgi:hypothetical protein
VENLDLKSIFKFYKRSEIWVIHFYDSSTKVKSTFEAEFKTFARVNKDITKVGAIDCKMNEALCEENSIVKGLHTKKQRRLPFTLYFTENFRDEGELYEGKNDWRSMKNAADAKLLNLVVKVTAENYENFLTQN